MSRTPGLIRARAKPRRVDEDVPLPDPFGARFVDVDMFINNPERTTGIDIANLNVYANGLRIYGASNPIQITGGTRHYLRNIELRRHLPRVRQNTGTRARAS